jgi:uncharacterized protein YneF (UPF0154 family)
MWIEPWKREKWVISRAAARWLQCAFWGITLFFLLCPFLIYWAYLSYLGRPTPLARFSVRLLIGLIGGIFALSDFMLDDAMKVFSQSRDRAGEPLSKLWRIALLLGFFGGSAADFWFVYRTQMQKQDSLSASPIRGWSL